MSLPRATAVGAAQDTAGAVTLDYSARLIRRKRLECEDGAAFLVDLAHTTHVEPGQAFLLEDGRAVRVEAAEEKLLAIT
ncbi:MAG: urease accessory protein UreE, partial [Pseudomonadota bacterium]